MKKKLRHWIGVVVLVFLLSFLLFILTLKAADNLMYQYLHRESQVWTDRHGEVIRFLPNEDGSYAVYRSGVPERFARALVESEDRFFYSHPGVNPVSTVRAGWHYIVGGKKRASSTLTQQLVKILLHNEDERTVSNKLKEIWYAFALESHTTKEEILEMYVNSIYLGNNMQGIQAASRLYFDRSPEMLDSDQIELLLDTIRAPSVYNPSMSKLDKSGESGLMKIVNSDTQFEMREFGEDGRNCGRSCQFTIDHELTQKVRQIVNENLMALYDKKVRNAAVVIIKEPEHQLLAIVGSPDPFETKHGYQINMARSARPIGSTVKPFLYALGFDYGLRPNTLVDDREYKYTTAAGFAHYPKNYDYKYRGLVTLHESLSNSLNIPTVKVLEYVGLPAIKLFFNEKLNVFSLQGIETHQYGIALGQMELDLLTLTHIFSIFSNHGELKPLVISPYRARQKNKRPVRVLDDRYIQLINKILMDRSRATDQFGLVGNLHLPQKNVAVKTGTSREYHDSWVVGYTPDFVVGVWVGNADNTPMKEVSGQVGAGAIWHDVMMHLFETEYYKKTPFEFPDVQMNGEKITLLYNQDAVAASVLLDDAMILSPHNGDEFQFEPDMRIPLEALDDIHWYINNENVGKGYRFLWEVEAPGTYTIEAGASDITVTVAPK